MHKVLFTGCTFSKDKKKTLKSKGFMVKPERMDLSEDEVISKLKGIEAYILGGEEIATKRVIESTKKLGIIAFLGAGYERYVDVKTATKKGIAVTNTPGANAYTVAEHTVALVLDAVKQITYLSNLTKKGGWLKRQAWNLRGKNLGIIGLGAVGGNVARILRDGFEMNVMYVSRTKKPDIEVRLKAKKVSLPELMKKSDIVSIHASYTNETLGMVGERELKMMKPSAVLVNTARAEIVDGHALYKILKAGEILAAAFDNYYQEPVPIPRKDKFKLLTLPDNLFILTPHTAYSSKEAVKTMEEMIMASLFSFFQGKIPSNCVNPEYKKYIRSGKGLVS